LVTGAIAFLWGGAQHPLTDSSLGVLGTDEYFRAFAMHVAGYEGWQDIHTGILAGPVLWALGAVGLARHFAAETDPGWSVLGLLALGLGAVAWSVVFVQDGFVAPYQAAAVMEPSSSVDAVNAFRNSQEGVIRLGLVAWLLIGTGIASIAAAAWASGYRSRLVRFVLIPGGLVVGLWPLAAWATGVFRPGPFTSGTWTATAILTSLWFTVGSVVLVRRRPAAAGPDPMLEADQFR